MTGASKILTVSYGTFSCTLEGFDDPFNTMKAIAEYFRDLAAEDRYFGAEPPTPDAAMLHRIAEREIHRRVEAKIQDNGVILRAAETDQPDVALPAPAPEPVIPQPAVAEVAAEQADSVAAKLQRIRRKQEKQGTGRSAGADLGAEAAALAQHDLAGADTAYSEDQHADLPAFSAQTGLAAMDAGIPDQIDALMNSAEAEVEVVEAEAEAEIEAQAPEFEEFSAADLDLDDDFADLAEAEDFAIEAAAETAADMDAGLDEAEVYDDAALLNSLRAELAPEVQAPAAVDQMADMLPEDDVDSALLSRLDEMLPEDLPEVAEPVAAAVRDDDALLAALGSMIDPEGSADDSGSAAVAAFAAPEPAALKDIEPELDTAPEAEAAPQRARARVIRIRRADAAAPAVAAAPASVLSAEAEAALQAELAALEAELGDLPPEPAPEAAAIPAPAPQPAEAVAPARPQRPAAPTATPVPAQAAEAAAPARPVEEDAVSRLMAQADSVMEGEENRRRHSAISHLKAAVAATVAERKIVGHADEGEPLMDAYRSDLDRVVRPRRPAASDAAPRAAAPDAPRTTPLVLVSEQRIDRPRAVPSPAPAPAMVQAAAPAAPRSVMPVRPRRVSAASAAPLPAAMQDEDLDAEIEADLADDPENVFSDAAGFEEFADNLGATRLPDLLEAAAVYCAEVLQRPEFSRPLLMRQVSSVQDGVSREDCLRGFGTLLRQGRITKVKRGLFALTDQSPYLAEARRNAG